jgi:hypothetical protein
MAGIVASLGPDADVEAVRAVLQSFVDAKLMLHADGRYLSLATDARAGYRRYGLVPPLGSVLSPGLRDTVQRLRAAGSPRALAVDFGRATLDGVRRMVIHCAARTVYWQNGSLRRLARLGAQDDLTT